MRRCPFCNKKVEAKYPDLAYLESKKLYVLSHYCHEDCDLAVAISVYGETAEEVIKRWEGETSDMVSCNG